MHCTKPFDCLEDEVYSTIVSKDYVTCDVVYYDVYDGVRKAGLAMLWLSLKHSTSFEDKDETDLPTF